MILICFLLSIFSLLVNVLNTGQEVEIIRFDQYGQDNGLFDDSACPRRILETRNTDKHTIIRFKRRVYRFDTAVKMKAWVGTVTMEGESGAVFIADGVMLHADAANQRYTLPMDVSRGDTRFGLLRVPSDTKLIKVQSTDTVDMAWNYTANDLVGIEYADDRGIVLADTLNFSYALDRTEIVAYQEGRLAIKGIRFVSGRREGPILDIRGMEAAFYKCEFMVSEESPAHTLVSLINCSPVLVEDSRMEGMATYGFLLNGCRHVRIRGLVSVGCHAPVVPASFTTDVLVERLHATGGVIDAHPSFYITYRDVTIEDGPDYWNCRALGIRLENCTFHVRDGVKGEYLYLGVLALRKEYSFLYDEYDVVCKNVDWVYEDQNYNGLHVNRCRDFIVDGCRTHEVSFGEPIRRFEIRNSRVGRVYGADSNIKADGTVFDGRLQQRLEIRPPLSGSFDGHMRVRRCQFKNYSNAPLIRYIQDARTQILFEDCHFADIGSLTEKTYHPPEMYEDISFLHCTFEGQVKAGISRFGQVIFD